MSMVTPALPVDSSEKKKAYPFCRICSIYMQCIWHSKIIDFPYFWDEVYTLGKRYIIRTTLHAT